MVYNLKVICYQQTSPTSIADERRCLCRVPTVDGDKTLTVRDGTQSGDRLRMRGYGVPTLGGRGRGDQYVHVKCACGEQASRIVAAMSCGRLQLWAAVHASRVVAEMPCGRLRNTECTEGLMDGGPRL